MSAADFAQSLHLERSGAPQDGTTIWSKCPVEGCKRNKFKRTQDAYNHMKQKSTGLSACAKHASFLADVDKALGLIEQAAKGDTQPQQAVAKDAESVAAPLSGEDAMLAEFAESLMNEGAGIAQNQKFWKCPIAGCKRDQFATTKSAFEHIKSKASGPSPCPNHANFFRGLKKALGLAASPRLQPAPEPHKPVPNLPRTDVASPTTPSAEKVNSGDVVADFAASLKEERNGVCQNQKFWKCPIEGCKRDHFTKVEDAYNHITGKGASCEKHAKFFTAVEDALSASCTNLAVLFSGSAEGCDTDSTQALQYDLARSFTMKCQPMRHVKHGGLKHAKVIVVPGGEVWPEPGEDESKAHCQLSALGEAGGEELARKVREDGAGYIGVCAGAFLAMEIKSFGLDDRIRAVEREEHGFQAKGAVKGYIPLNASKAAPALTGLHQALEPILAGVHYEDGPLLQCDESDDICVLATYGCSAVAPKMQGKAAVVACRVGKGAVVLMSPHPELTPNSSSVLPNLATAARKWVDANWTGSMVQDTEAKVTGACEMLGITYEHDESEHHSLERAMELSRELEAKKQLQEAKAVESKSAETKSTECVEAAKPPQEAQEEVNTADTQEAKPIDTKSPSPKRCLEGSPGETKKLKRRRIRRVTSKEVTSSDCKASELLEATTLVEEVSSADARAPETLEATKPQEASLAETKPSEGLESAQPPQEASLVDLNTQQNSVSPAQPEEGNAGEWKTPKRRKIVRRVRIEKSQD